jgi:hypothetical protein
VSKRIEKGPFGQSNQPKRGSNPFRDDSTEPKRNDGPRDSLVLDPKNSGNKPSANSNDSNVPSQGNKVSNITNVTNRTINITDVQGDDDDEDYDDEDDQPNGNQVRKNNPSKPATNVPKKSAQPQNSQPNQPLKPAQEANPPQTTKTPNNGSASKIPVSQASQPRIVPNTQPTVGYPNVTTQIAPGTYRPSTYATPTAQSYPRGPSPQPTYISRPRPANLPDSLEPVVTQVKTYIDGVLQYSGPERPNGDYGNVIYPGSTGVTYQTAQPVRYPATVYQSNPPCNLQF